MARIADFTTATYTGITPVCVRSTSGYSETTAGVLTSFATNTLRQTNKGLLVEPAATNLVLRSQELSNTGYWDLQSSTVTADATAAPDGTTTADRINEAANETYVGIVSSWVQVPAGAPFTMSMYFKRNTASKQPYVQQNDTDNAGSNFKAWAQYFNVDTLADGGTEVLAGGQETDSNVVVQALGSSWFRVSFTVTTTTTQRVRLYLGGCDATGNRFGTTGMSAYLWGVQLEAGAVLTSYFPTTSASATRAADTVSFTIPSGVTQLTYTFDDSSTQNVTVTAGASYSIPTNLNRQYIKYIDDNSGGTTVALTGVSGAGAVGTLGQTRTKALTGNSATGTVGTLKAAPSIALVGNAATGAVGSLGQARSVALTSVAGTGAVGSFGKALSAALTGNQGVGAVGTLLPALSLALAGVAASGAVGTLTATSGVSIALTGVSATGNVGSLGSLRSILLSGVSATGQVGSLGFPVPPAPPNPDDFVTVVGRTYRPRLQSRSVAIRGRSRIARA